MSKSECSPATSSHEPLAGTQLHLIMHENLEHSTTSTETFGNPSGYNYASSSCNSRAICDHPQNRSIHSTSSGIKEAGLPGQRTVTPAIFCRSRRLAETLVSISCTRVLGKMISVQLSTTVSVAAIHTSSCTAVVDEHHTGHKLQELHPAGKLQDRLKLVEIDFADNECTPPLKRKASYVQQQLLDSTLLNSHHA
jgi:hypothetical protein